ncbi:hypothetical protein O1L60_37225 [Streptomyces diastatochromogenes]|nr:hypothetical protein [Streptomyces diastatochromogenes]
MVEPVAAARADDGTPPEGWFAGPVDAFAAPLFVELDDRIPGMTGLAPRSRKSCARRRARPSAAPSSSGSTGCSCWSCGPPPSPANCPARTRPRAGTPSSGRPPRPASPRPCTAATRRCADGPSPPDAC